MVLSYRTASLPPFWNGLLIEGGYLNLHERTFAQGGTTYTAVTLTPRGRDALSGGIELPEFRDIEVQ